MVEASDLPATDPLFPLAVFATLATLQSFAVESLMALGLPFSQNFVEPPFLTSLRAMGEWPSKSMPRDGAE